MQECNIQPTYRPIDSFRGIFAILIVLHHYLPAINVPYHYDFGNTIVLFFFVLSGFHITLSWKDKIFGNSQEFLIKRCAKIFPLQWLTLLLFVVFGVNIESLWAIPFHMTLTQSIMPFWEINFSLNVPSWFLSSIFFCYLLTPLMLKYGKRNLRGFIMMQVCVIVFYTFFLYVASKYVGLRWLAYISPFSRIQDYSIGMTLGFLWGELSKRRILSHYGSYRIFSWRGVTNINNLFFEIIVTILISLCMVWTSLFEFNPYKILRYPIIVAFIIVFTLSKGTISKALTNRITGWLGQISMSIYMMHSLILNFTKDLMDLPLWLNISITFTLILMVSHVVNYYFLPFSSNFIQQMCCKILVLNKK